MKKNKSSSMTRAIAILGMSSIFLLLPTLVLAGAFECPDTILDPGKGTEIKYHTNHYVLFSGCEKQSGTRHQNLPNKDGKSCAAPRIDGCSLHESKYLFTERDKKLMKAACNRHDLCYSTYGTTKLGCDGGFAKNLEYAKNEFNGSYTTSVIVAAVLLLGDHKAGQIWGKNNNCKN